MNTKQLYKALIQNEITEPFFDGIYPRDLLVDITSKPNLIICNTDTSDKKGEHWLLFFFNKDKSVDFFDSLGKNIYSYGKEIVNFAKTYAVSFNESTDRMQPFNSSLCGHYCLFYAYYKCKGYNMKNILKKMSSADKVKKFVYKKYNICNSSSCKLLQTCVDC